MRRQELGAHSDPRIDAVRLEQVLDHAFVDSERSRKYRSLTCGFLPHDRKDASTQQASAGAETAPHDRALLQAGCEQSEDEVDGRPSPRHVVLEIREQPLV